MALVESIGGWRRFWWTLWLVWIAMIAAPFMLHSVALGARGLGQDLTGLSRLYHPGDRVATLAIFAHMVAGGAITLLAPLQLIPVLRWRWPGLHRALGRLIVVAGLVAGLGGLIYIARQGTIGGPLMSVGFALYGALLLLAAGQALRHARARRFDRHQEWALRLFVLAMGSWIYRVHYGIWAALTGGAGSTPAFDGPFDQVQVFAFYLPYLALLEVLIRRRRAQGAGWAARKGSRAASVSVGEASTKK
jgi:hypothetical protein